MTKRCWRAAYVDLNPIRAGLAETLEGSDFTSVQRRIQARGSDEQTSNTPVAEDDPPAAEAELAVKRQHKAELPVACFADSFLAPLSLGVRFVAVHSSAGQSGQVSGWQFRQRLQHLVQADMLARKM